MNKELKAIRIQLRQMAEREAWKLWRLARKAISHGCKPETVAEIREEADWLYRTGRTYSERLITRYFRDDFQYAFKY